MNRSGLIKFGVAFLFFLLACSLFNLQLFQGAKFRELSDKNSIRLLSQPGARGRIIDRDGFVIADNKLSYDVLVAPQEQGELDLALNSVSRILGISEAKLSRAYRMGFTAVSVPVAIARNISIKQAIALEELKTELPSLVIQPNPKRYYPQGKLAAHVLGYVSQIDRWRLTKLEDYGYKTKDIVGFGGIEEKYDYYLRYEDGGLSIEVDHRGRFTRVLGFRPPSSGKDIQLTLNAKIQKIAEDALGDKTGSVVIMDPYSGEILAMASAPSFDPAVFVDKTDVSLSDMFSDPGSPLINRAISSAYPAGSVFKTVVATAALENKKIDLNTAFLCQGSVAIGNKSFACWSTHHDQNIIRALTHSCNVFFYKTGLLVGAQAIHDYALKLGFASPSSIELPYETSGFIPSPLWRKIKRFTNWFNGDTANLSIGQGDVLITPLQAVRMISVYANGGYLVSPSIVKSIAGSKAGLYGGRPVHLGLRKDTIDIVRQGLLGVVLEPSGTGHVLFNPALSVAGKTGTAQAPPGIAHAWFAGFFPFESPKFAICVFLERGEAGHYSCLVAKQIIEAMNSEGLI